MISAGVVLNIINRFLCSADASIADIHAASDCKDAAAIEASITLAKKAWALMQDTARTDVPMPHDGYLKIFQLSGALLNYDCILFDEFQDSNEVTRAIIGNQKCRKVFVGDARQSIYAFRGASNALNAAKIPVQLQLTASFRFGEGVAAFANAVLAEHSPHTDLIEGKGAHNTIFAVDRRYPHTVLCRTNAMLFMEAVSAMKNNFPFGFVGGVQHYKFDSILDAYWLKKNRKSSIKDKFIQSFQDFDEMMAYSESLDDRELRFLGKVVKEYGDEIPSLIADIQARAVPTLTGHEIVMTTGHRSKGLEFMDVVLTEDYTDMRTKFDPVTKEAMPPDEQEINLLYVAATRALRGLQLPDPLIEWLSDTNPELARKIASSSAAGNASLPSLENTASNSKQAPFKDNASATKTLSVDSSSIVEDCRQNALKVLGSMGARERKILLETAETFAEEAMACQRDNPKRAAQLALASGLMANILNGQPIVH
jgi:hypothetical protein